MTASAVAENGITAESDARGNTMARRKITIEWKTCERAWGWAYIGEDHIQLDPRLLQKPKLLLEIAAHEVAHLVFPEAEEKQIDMFGKQVADVIWRLNFRRAQE